MTNKDRRLGRGLAALLGGSFGEQEGDPSQQFEPGQPQLHIHNPDAHDQPHGEQLHFVDGLPHGEHQQHFGHDQGQPHPQHDQNHPAHSGQPPHEQGFAHQHIVDAGQHGLDLSGGQPQQVPFAHIGIDEEKVLKGEAGLMLLSVYEIDDNPFQPRRDFSEPEIVSLSESLKEHDMIQPIVVRRINDRYQLISGERRLRAAIHAGWQQVPARVRQADDRLVAELAIVENLHRSDLNPIEKALSFQRYLREHQCKNEDLAKRIKIDRSTISNLLRLLELPQQVSDALRGGFISAGHARALLPLGDHTEQIKFCQKIRDEGLSVRNVEQLVNDVISAEDGEPLAVVSESGESKPTAAQQKKARSQQISALEQQLRLALGTKIEIKQSGKGRGKIVIQFNSNEEFERIRNHLIESTSGPMSQVG